MSDPNLPIESKSASEPKSGLAPGVPYLIGVGGVTAALMLFGVYLFIRSAVFSAKTMLLLLIPLVAAVVLWRITRKSSN